MWVTAYTDASVRNGKSYIAYWLRSSLGRVVHHEMCAANDNIHAEIEAALAAVARAKKEWPTTIGVQINTDCLAVLQAFKGKRFERPELARAQEHCKSLDVWIQVKHIKGHTAKQDVRAYLNRQVDRLASQRS